MNRSIKFYDAGMLPYHSHLRKYFYSLFPGEIRYTKKGVRLDGISVICYNPFQNGARPILNKGITPDAHVIGNVYEMTQDAYDFISKVYANCRIVVIDGVSYQSPYVSTYSVDTLRGYQSFTSLRELDLKAIKQNNKLLFLYESQDQIKTP